MLVDLHLHTTASDGTWSREQVYEYVRKADVRLFSITDHDLPQTIDVPPDLAGRYVPGTEIDAQIDGRTVHLLVYGEVAEDAELRSTLSEQRQARRGRVAQIVQRLQDCKVPITLGDVLAEAGADNHSLGRPHVARALVARGFVFSVQDAFDRYLAEGREAYVGLLRMHVSEIIRAAHGARATVVLAHPHRLREWDNLELLCSYGIDGVEVAHAGAPLETRNKLERIASEYGLLQTGGSDCHGYTFPEPVALEGSLIDDFRSRVESWLSV